MIERFSDVLTLSWDIHMTILRVMRNEKVII